MWSSTTSNGVKLSAIKFIQRIIIVQTRGISDPRVAFHKLLLYMRAHCVTLCNLQLQKNDPNISNVPADHPFIPALALEAEGMKLLERVITILYASQ